MHVCHCYGRVVHDVYQCWQHALCPKVVTTFFSVGGSKLWEASTPHHVGLSGAVALCYSEFLETSHDLRGGSVSALAAYTFCKVPYALVLYIA